MDTSTGLNDPVTTLTGVGSRIAARLAGLGIHTVQDLLFHLPRRYIDRTRLHAIGSLLPGQEVLVEGEIELAQVQYGKRRSLLCRISDGTGSLTLRFFHFSRMQQNKLVRGSYLQCWGQVRRVANKLEMIHPEYHSLSSEELGQVEKTLTPVYPATEGVSQAKFRKLTIQSLDIFESATGSLSELLPEEILTRLALPELAVALSFVHRPPPEAEVDKLLQGIHPSQQRLSFEELLAHHLSLRLLRGQFQQHRSPSLAKNENIIVAFLDKLPFQLTGAQQSVLEDIQQDLSRNSPMLRLIQGDVGSGKTVVAAIAALQALKAGYQVAYMAPTELLAEQHYINISNWLEPFQIPVRLLTGKLPRAEHDLVRQELNVSEAQFVVGTHALFQESVQFACLGLVIIDEQHRFGVHQRLSLIDKAGDLQPHQLIMTATPIPRTLAMTLFADLDISVIDELPPGRQEIKTIAVSSERRAEVIDRIAASCRQGRQVYWVCTLIEESDALQCQTATDTCEVLKETLPDLAIGLIHGRMKADEKAGVMAAFKAAELDVLVATTVIEVGVDVANASLMVIENSERLGLSQLHQLRGRVGRGTQQSDCVLIYKPPLSDFAQIRLETMRQSNDGFEIAQKDMELRGPGDLLGTRQTGLPALRIADLSRDAHMLPEIQNTAEILINNYPEHVQLLTKRWLADRVVFANV
ncbi:MAG: ATP-dependent DNA helicase RecG [Gammaproteobacteria bacterium]|nr:ATP-dependent DNA helicase RecG [Gammaproteobacteria bacterium]